MPTSVWPAPQLVKRYSDRSEISNPGGLVGDLTLENILSPRILRWRIVGRPEGDYDRRLWRLGAGGGVFGAGPGLGGGPAGLGRGPERLAETRGVGAAARRLRKAGVGAGQI